MTPVSSHPRNTFIDELLSLTGYDDSLEFRLLLLCARSTPDTSATERIRALVGQGVNWDVVAARAHQHRVLPLLCRSLDRVASDLVSTAVMERLRTASRANATRNLMLTAELFRVIDLLQAHEIPTIPHKGPVLAALAYGDISLRQFADLDIIVPYADVRRAAKLLASNGYTIMPQKTNNQQPLSARTEKDFTLRRHDGLVIELHWSITTDMFHPIQIDPQFLWRDLATASVAGRTVRTHKTEDQLLITCIHGASHGWQRLVWLCDFAELVRSGSDIDWARAFATADELGARRMFCHALALIRDLLDANLPHTVDRAVQQDRALVTLSKQVAQWLFSDRPVLLGEMQRYFIRLREHPFDKIRVASKQARSYLELTARDAELFPVPGYLNWLLYIVRPFRLAHDYGITPFVRFFKGVFQF